MQLAEAYETALSEIRSVLDAVDPLEVEHLLEAILGAGRVFVAGAGRMGLMSRAFVMRLMHLGLQAHMVGDTTTPAIRPGDLLLANSGSGHTSIVHHAVSRAKQHGASIAACTAHPDSPIGRLADVIVRVPAPSKVQGSGEKKTSQPMGNLSEQCLLVLLDAVSWMLQERLGFTEEEMWARHANLE